MTINIYNGVHELFDINFQSCLKSEPSPFNATNLRNLKRIMHLKNISYDFLFMMIFFGMKIYIIIFLIIIY